MLFEHRVIGNLGPLPVAPRGRTFAGSITPQRGEHLQAQSSEALDLAVSPAQFRGGTTAKERRKYEPKDFAQERVLTPQTLFDLGHEGFRQPQGFEGLLEGLDDVAPGGGRARGAPAL